MSMLSSAVKRDLEIKGYAVVPGVLDQDTCNDYTAELAKWIASFGDGFPVNKGSILHDYGIAHHPVYWKVRMAAKRVFSALWGTEKLLTSFDGGAISPPPESSKHAKFYEEGQDTLHHDQGPHRIGLHAYQGAVYLEEAEDTDHCLQVLEGSHRHFQEFFESMVPRNSDRIEHRPLSQPEKDWFEKAGCLSIRVAVPKGGIVLWDSRLVHAGAPPICGRQNPKWRYVCFVCMAPAIWARSADIKAKVTGYQDMKCSFHWPCSCIIFFEKKPATVHDVTSLPPEATCQEAKRMVGEIPYNFEDGDPNGPPAPQF